MLDGLFVKKFKKICIFVVVFTILFILFFNTLKYTLPFVLGFLIAFSTKNFNSTLQRKLKVHAGVSSILTTTIVFAILSTAVTLLVYKATTESIILLSQIPSIEKISVYIDKLLREITSIIGQIEPVVVSRIYEYLQTLLAQIISYSIRLLNSILSIVISLPSVFLLAVITFIATYLFSKDLGLFRKSFYSIFSVEGKEKMQNIVESSIAMTLGYAKAYSIVVFITFVEVLIGLSVLGINYALILSILCAIFDLLPIIGMIMIFIPIVIYKFYIGENIIAIGLIVLFIIVTVVRQIIEPKIVSQTLDLHPVLILAAIFIGLKLSGVIGMIYFIALLVAYKVLRKVNVL